MTRWVGVDLDGTLAHSESWGGTDKIGKPIPDMINRVSAWIADGVEVRIFTARASAPDQVEIVRSWSLKHIGIALEVTNVKDFGMIELWDDRAVRVIKNQGRCCCDGGIMG